MAKNDPCWEGYKQIGTKMKNGKKVPNCVPSEETLVLKKSRGKSIVSFYKNALTKTQNFVHT